MSNRIAIKEFFQWAREATWATDLATDHRMAMESLVIDTNPQIAFSKNMPAGGTTDQPWMEDSANAGAVLTNDFAEAMLIAPLDYNGNWQFIDMIMGSATYGSYGAGVTGPSGGKYTHTWPYTREFMNSITIEGNEGKDQASSIVQAFGMKMLELEISGDATSAPDGAILKFKGRLGGQKKSLSGSLTSAISPIARVPILMSHLSAFDDGSGDSAVDVLITKFSLSIKPAMAFPNFYGGSVYPREPIRSGLVEVLLKFTREYTTDALITKYQAGTLASPSMTFTSASRQFKFTLNKAVIPTGGAKQPQPNLRGLMEQEVTWRCLWLPGTGDLTIVAITDQSGAQA